MATRALIGYLNPDNTITTTYNHYDGYPDNLGKALDRHYSTDEKAKEIANMGYVSFVEPVNGDIEAKNQEAPVTIGDDDLVSSLQYFKEQADGTDYAYLWAPQTGDWMHARTSMKMEDFVDAFALSIDFQDEDDMADYDTINNMEEGYKAKWKKFLGENIVDETEFNFLNYILGDKYSDDEIETYLKSDSFIEASRNDDMEMVASNASNWENEFFEFFDNVDNV